MKSILSGAAALTLVWLLWTTGECAQGEGANMILNGDLANDSDGDGMADHWQFSGDADVKVTWARDAGAHGGYSQRITCTQFAAKSPSSHAMLAQVNAFALRRGHWYRLSFNARGEIASRAVNVGISDMKTWDSCGLSDVFRVGPEWRPQGFVFCANRDISTDIRLQIWFTEVGSLWIDDVRLEEVPAGSAATTRRYTEVVPSIGSKNLVPNGSFECGTSGWGSITQGVDWGDSGLITLVGGIDGHASEDGTSSFRIDLDKATALVLAFDYFDVEQRPVHMTLVASRGWIGVTPGQEYTLSAYVKADPADTPCVLAAQEAFGGLQTHGFEATGEWRRVTFTFRPQADQVFVAVGPDLTNSPLRKATVWVDAIQLEMGSEATSYEPRSPVEVGLQWERPGHLFSSPEDARAIVTVYNAGTAAARVHVDAAVTDFFDKEAARPRLKVEVPPGRGVQQVLRLGVEHKGFYRIKLRADPGVVLPINAERCGVIDAHPDANGIFGMNHAYAAPELLTLSREIGLTWMRDWSLKWQAVEPERGRFDFSGMDFQIDRIVDHGLNVDALLPFPSSDWSSSAPPDVRSSQDMGEHARMAYKPRDLNEFADYVRATVKRYADRVHVWEILNEPLYTGYAVPRSTGHTVQDYVALLKTAYQAIKEVDPKAFVIGGVADDPDGIVQDFIPAGGLDWLDGINVHIYPVIRQPESYLTGLEKLNAMMQEMGKRRPIYFTEGSYYGEDDLPFKPFNPGDSLMRPLDSELECASYQARFNIILMSQKVKMIIYHAGTGGSLNNPSVGGIFFEWHGAPRKMAISQSVMTSLFGADTECIGSASDRVRSFAFHSRGRSVVALWDEKYQHLALAPPRGAKVVDLAGAQVRNAQVTLDEIPCYIVFNEEMPIEQVRDALRGCISTG